MGCTPEPGPLHPSPGARRVISILLILHFFAILTAVTASSDRDYPAPLLAVWANAPLRPYLQATFMNNAYRFFAPNPGAPTVLWFRVHYHDWRVRWVEAPIPASSLLRAGYQRRLNLAMQLSQQVTPVAGEKGRYRLSDLGEICLASYVRHVADRYQRSDGDGKPVPVRTVGVYFVQHASRTPAQVREGWEAADLRTYQALFAGAYRPDGERVDDLRPFLKEQPMSYVAAGILQVDLYPLLSTPEGTEATRLIDGLSLSAPVRRLLVRFPELADPARAGGDVKQRIQQLAGVP